MRIVKKMKPKTEIPLLKTTVRIIDDVNNKGIQFTKNNVKYIGIGFFYIAKDIISAGMIKKMESLEQGRISPYFKGAIPTEYKDYLFSDFWCEYKIDNNIVLIKTRGQQIAFNYNFYSYVKNLGDMEFRFTENPFMPAGIFRKGKFMGQLYPIRLIEDVKKTIPATELKISWGLDGSFDPIDDDDIPF